MSYDYIIIGGGPTGLTLALYLSEIGRKCLLIDNNASLGGCHRVTRVDGHFTEHGPRIYSDAYLNVMIVLEKLGLNWNDCFTPYNFSIGDIQGYTFNNLTNREKLDFALEFLGFCFGFDKKHTTMKEFMDSKNFTKEARDYIDRICRLTDGAGSERYTLDQFLQLANQNIFRRIYQPRVPNDQLLFKRWEEKLLENGVDIIKSCNVHSVSKGIVSTNRGNFMGKRIIAAIPPFPFSKLRQNFGEWALRNSYETYIPITFRWKQKVQLEKVWGFPRSDWGIAFVVLTDYMNPEPGYELVISTCVTRVETKSSFTNKTALECGENELKTEVFRQLKLAFPNLQSYDNAIIHPDKDTAFVQTKSQEFVEMHVEDGLYFVGTHNGRSDYQFTSMESAVTNALYAFQDLECQEIRIKKNYLTLKNIFICIFILILLVIVFKSRG